MGNHLFSEPEPLRLTLKHYLVVGVAPIKNKYLKGHFDDVTVVMELRSKYDDVCDDLSLWSKATYNNKVVYVFEVRSVEVTEGKGTSGKIRMQGSNYAHIYMPLNGETLEEDVDDPDHSYLMNAKRKLLDEIAHKEREKCAVLEKIKKDEDKAWAI